MATTELPPPTFQLQQLAILHMGLDARLCWGFAKGPAPLSYFAISNEETFLGPPYPPSKLVHEYDTTLPATTLDTADHLRRFLNYNTFHVGVSAAALYRKLYSLLQETPVLVEVFCSHRRMVGYFEDQPFGLCFITEEHDTKTCVQIPMYYVMQLTYPVYEEGVTAGLPKVYIYTVHPTADEDD